MHIIIKNGDLGESEKADKNDVSITCRFNLNACLHQSNNYF
jgi:hypothetical protein